MDKQRKALAKLGLTETEVEEVLVCDKKIEQGEKLFELSKDQEKASKKARQVAKAPTAYNFSKRERKADESKKAILQNLVEGLKGLEVENLQITNDEREFLFTFNEKKYKVVLSAPRS